MTNSYRWWLCVVVLLGVAIPSVGWFVAQPASVLRAGVALASLAAYVVVRLWAMREAS